MSDVQRPTVLTVLGVLAIIGGVLSAIVGVLALLGSFILFKVSMGAGLLVLLGAAIAIASGVVGLMAGVKIMGNKPKGVYFLKIYAYIGIAGTILSTIGSVVAVGSQAFSVGGLIKNMIARQATPPMKLIIQGEPRLGLQEGSPLSDSKAATKLTVPYMVKKNMVTTMATVFRSPRNTAAKARKRETMRAGSRSG